MQEHSVLYCGGIGATSEHWEYMQPSALCMPPHGDAHHGDLQSMRLTYLLQLR